MNDEEFRREGADFAAALAKLPYEDVRTIARFFGLVGYSADQDAEEEAWRIHRALGEFRRDRARLYEVRDALRVLGRGA